MATVGRRLGIVNPPTGFGLSESLLGQGNNGHFAPFSWAG
jgi:hypothetical protein